MDYVGVRGRHTSGSLSIWGIHICNYQIIIVIITVIKIIYTSNVGTAGTNSESIRNILGKHIKRLQKTSILGTAHILQEVLM